MTESSKRFGRTTARAMRATLPRRQTHAYELHHRISSVLVAIRHQCTSTRTRGKTMFAACEIRAAFFFRRMNSSLAESRAPKYISYGLHADNGLDGRFFNDWKATSFQAALQKKCFDKMYGRHDKPSRVSNPRLFYRLFCSVIVGTVDDSRSHGRVFLRVFKRPMRERVTGRMPPRGRPSARCQRDAVRSRRSCLRLRVRRAVSGCRAAAACAARSAAPARRDARRPT